MSVFIPAQNGVLKALSFMFEYIGEMAKDYIYAVSPLLEDALMDRDLVHRQTACTTVGHVALGEQFITFTCSCMQWCIEPSLYEACALTLLLRSRPHPEL